MSVMSLARREAASLNLRTASHALAGSLLVESANSTSLRTGVGAQPFISGVG